MKLNKLYIVLALMLTIVGCSKENTSGGGVALSDSEMQFISDPNSELAAKGSIIEEFEQIESIGVYAFYNSSIYVNNTPTVQEGSYWVLSPSMSWPSSGSVGFVAYSPYLSYMDSSTAGFSVYSNSVNTVIINYAMPTDVTLHKDLLVASSQGSNGDIVSLWFKHALASVSFKVHDEQDVTLIDQEITLSGIYDAATLMATSSGFSWSSLSSSLSKEFTTGYIDAPQELSSSLVSSENYIMVPPQSIPSSATIYTSLSDGTELEYKISGTWEAGNNYTYVVYVAADGTVEIDSVIVTPWEQLDEEQTQDYSQTDGSTVGAEADEWTEEQEQTMVFSTEED